jgi:hypothetical protein
MSADAASDDHHQSLSLARQRLARELAALRERVDELIAELDARRPATE